MKNLEIKTIEHKGIKVIIKIDYDKGEASIVEFNQSQSNYVPKQWIFAKRGLEYMKGWEVIIEALAVAVKECKKELELSLAQSSAFVDGEIEKALGLKDKTKRK